MLEKQSRLPLWIRKRHLRYRKKLIEQQQQVAYRLYSIRQERGYSGDANQDWQKAKKIVANPIKFGLFLGSQSARKTWRRIINRSESSTTEHALDTVVQDLKRLAIFDLLQLLANVTIVISLASFLSGGEQQRHNTEVYEAWQVITSAHDQPGSGGRRRALEFLNATPGTPGRLRWYGAVWPRESLDGIDLSGTYLLGVRLPYAILRNADLSNATLHAANFRGAILDYANFKDASLNSVGIPQTNREKLYSWLRRDDGWNNLYKTGVVDFTQARMIQTNLQDADLREANLTEAQLFATDLKGASLIEATLRSARLGGVILNGTSFHEADLYDVSIHNADIEKTSFHEANMQDSEIDDSTFQSSYFTDTDLRGASLVDSVFNDADFWGARFSETILFDSDMSKVENLTNEQLAGSQRVFVCKTELPSHIDIDADRDCDQMPRILFERYPNYYGNIKAAETEVEQGRD